MFTIFKRHCPLLFVAAVSLVVNVAQGQNKLICDDLARVDLNDVTLEDLMDVPVFLSASQQAVCTKEAANIVNSISGEQILSSGARDLIDVLNMVPGFSAGVNLTNEVGLGIRGFQADTGKISVYIDGIMMTERRFGTTSVGGSRFPIENIDRIEIIRGPSSIQHGSFAQLGMINIITKNAEQLNGVSVTTNYGHFQRGEARKNINLAAGKKFDDLEVTFSGKAGDAQRSDSIYTDAYGNSFDMVGKSDLDTLYGNLSLKYRNLQIRFLAEEHGIQSYDGYVVNTDIALPDSFIHNQFNTYATDLDYKYEFNSHVKLDSAFEFSRQSPWEQSWHYTNGQPSTIEDKVVVDHYKFDSKLTVSSDAGSYWVLGNSYHIDEHQREVYAIDQSLITFTNYTAYTEAVYKTDWVDILAGLRFDAYNKFGTNLAPRLALTKQFDKFHYKLLYAHAFQAPLGGAYLMNLRYRLWDRPLVDVPKLRPELTYTYEMELGYELTKNLSLIANASYTQINNIFVYSYDERYNDFFRNAEGLDTLSIEAGIQYKHENWGKFNINYSYYRTLKNTAGNFYQAAEPDYVIVDYDNAGYPVYQETFGQGDIVHDNMNLGFPTHKVALNHFIQLTPKLSFNHNLIFFSDRLGYSGSTLVHHNPTWLYNMYFRYQDFAVKGLDVGLGLYDAFNARYQYVQQFNGSHPALPGPSRELMLKVSYAF